MLAVVLMVLGAWTNAVSAQDMADPMAPAFFTFTTGPVDESSVPEGTELRDDLDMQMVNATDPRASGLITISANSTMIELGEGAVMTASMSERLINDGGAWAGTGRFVMAGGDDGGVIASMDVLTGEGGYEGLTLIVGQFEGGGPMSNWGVILPSDQVPAVPEPIEAPAE